MFAGGENRHQMLKIDCNNALNAVLRIIVRTASRIVAMNTMHTAIV